jgi:hypothetical protein
MALPNQLRAMGRIEQGGVLGCLMTPGVDHGQATMKPCAWSAPSPGLIVKVRWLQHSIIRAVSPLAKSAHLNFLIVRQNG